MGGSDLKGLCRKVCSRAPDFVEDQVVVFQGFGESLLRGIWLRVPLRDLYGYYKGSGSRVSLENHGT